VAIWIAPRVEDDRVTRTIIEEMPSEHPGPERGIVAAATYITGLYAFQQMMVIPALPVFERDLGATTTWTTWLLTAFLLSSCLATPILGRFGDQFGAKRVLNVVLWVFAFASLIGTFAPNIWVLIGARVLQGFTGASVPLCLAIVRQNLPPRRAGSAVASISVVLMIATGLGAAISGVVVAWLSWRFLFAIVALAAVAGAIWLRRVVPDSEVEESARIDTVGAVLLGAGLISLLLALTKAPSWGVTSARTLGLAAAGVAILTAWTLVELRVPEPLVDVRMLCRRHVLVANAVQFFGLGLGTGTVFVLVPRLVTTPGQYPPELARLVHYGFNANVALAGLYLLPLAIGGFLARDLSATLGRRKGWKRVLVLGPAVCGSSLISLAIWHSRPWQVIAALLPVGLAHSMMAGSIAKFIVEDVEPNQTGAAIGMSVVIRQIGASIGAQAMALALSVDTIAGTKLPAESAFTLAFLVGAATAALAVAAALFAHSPPRLPELVPAESGL
jgi:MFS family permease